MGWTIEGAAGSQWTVATWVGRNAVRYLGPALRDAKLWSMAATLEDADASGVCRASLRETLDDERQSRLFRLAVTAALAAIERDGASTWHDPAAFAPFVLAFRRLDGLGRVDGNELVIELASSPLNFAADHVIGSAEVLFHTT